MAAPIPVGTTITAVYPWWTRKEKSLRQPILVLPLKHKPKSTTAHFTINKQVLSLVSKC